MAAYSYLLVDMMSNSIIQELPLSGVTFESRLNGTGTFSGNLYVGDARVRQLDPWNCTKPARTMVFVDRDGVLVWGGILWTRTPDSSTHMLTLQASETVSYFAHRHITRDVDYFIGSFDQAYILNDTLGVALAAGTFPALNVTTPSSTGVIRQVTYKKEERREILNEITTLCSLNDGMDWASPAIWNGTSPQAKVEFSFPRRGNSAATTGYVFDLGNGDGAGNIISYRWPEDGTTTGNTVYAIGAGSGTTTLLSVQTNAALRAAGYPLMEIIQNAKQINNQALLDDSAAAYLTARQLPIVSPELTVRADMDPPLGTYTVGDEARVIINDEWFTGAGVDQAFRIQSIAVTPGDGTTAEKVRLTLGNVVP